MGSEQIEYAGELEQIEAIAEQYGMDRTIGEVLAELRAQDYAYYVQRAHMLDDAEGVLARRIVELEGLTLKSEEGLERFEEIIREAEAQVA